MTIDTDDLLMDVLGQVPVHGWTEAALDAADPARARVLGQWPNGVPDALDAFARWADDRMEAGLDGVSIMDLKIRDRIATMVRLRLEALELHREAVRRETLFLSTRRPDLAARLVWRTASRIWYLAGDNSTDFNHYSKRGLLSGVIASTTLCWLGDETEGRTATWEFLARRIENVMSLGKTIGRVKAFADPSDALGRFVELAGRVRYRS